MFVLYEEDGAFKAGTVLTDNEATLQVENTHGKRVKLKRAHVLMEFREPGPADLLARPDGGDSLTAPRSPRWALQRWASFKRRFTPDYYARIVERWIGRQLGSGWNRIVVTDLRDPVEEAMLRRLGAKVVRVHRPELAALPSDTAMHVSEQHHRIKADADILNDGSMQALADAALECVSLLEVRGV